MYAATAAACEVMAAQQHRVCQDPRVEGNLMDDHSVLVLCTALAGRIGASGKSCGGVCSQAPRRGEQVAAPAVLRAAWHRQDVYHPGGQRPLQPHRLGNAKPLEQTNLSCSSVRWAPWLAATGEQFVRMSCSTVGKQSADLYHQLFLGHVTNMSHNTRNSEAECGWPGERWEICPGPLRQQRCVGSAVVQAALHLPRAEVDARGRCVRAGGAAAVREVIRQHGARAECIGRSRYWRG